jgi:long-subunit fatty acid transport protein
MLNSSEVELVISYTIARQCEVGVGIDCGGVEFKAWKSWWTLQFNESRFQSMMIITKSRFENQNLEHWSLETWVVSYNPNLVDASNFINSKMLAF